MDYQTVNHTNYYKFIYNTTNPRKIAVLRRKERAASIGSPKLRRTSSLLDFSSSTKLPNTETSSVRSNWTESLSSESKPAKLFTQNKYEYCFQLKRKSKPWDSILSRKSSSSQSKLTKKSKRRHENKFINTATRIKNFFSYLGSADFFNGSRTVLLPASNSPEEIKKRIARSTETRVKTDKKTTTENKTPELDQKPELQREPLKANTLTTCYSGRFFSKVENTQASQGYSSIQTALQAQNYREKYIEPGCCILPSSSSNTKPPRGRLPEFEHFGLRFKDAQESQEGPCHRDVQDRQASTYAEPKNVVVSVNTSGENYSVLEQYNVNDQQAQDTPRRRIPDIKHLYPDRKNELHRSPLQNTQDIFNQEAYNQSEARYCEQSPFGVITRQPLHKQNLKYSEQTQRPVSSYKDSEQEIEENINYQSEGETSDSQTERHSNTVNYDHLRPIEETHRSALSVQGVQHPRRELQQVEQADDRRYVLVSHDPPEYFQTFFWRRQFSHQLELDCPFDLDNSYAEELYQIFRRRYYTRNTSDHHQEHLTEPLDVPPDSSFYQPGSREHRGRMGSLEDHERKVIIEFCHLLEKSKQLFNGLRELPQYGHKQWHSYFGRTFDVYTKLWKFQQQHRAMLDSKYGLKRWQIGEIASKIGQLYYHFYLRTSEIAYLNEAFSFYQAIRGRSYYTKASKEDKCELMVKKLRYYARFIVVGLLLKKINLVLDLIKELDNQIEEYGNTYDPDDQIEWTVVVDEVKAFIQAEPVIAVIHPDNHHMNLRHRLTPQTTPPVERSSHMNLSLQEVLIIGSSSQQVKFSELTIDMFRMLQTLEKEPTGEIQRMYDDSPRQRFNLTPSALNNRGYNLETAGPHSENPHKYLLFKPSPSQILVYLASGCNDLPPNGALLLYISADGHIVQSSKHPEDGYDVGGLITTSKNELYRESSKEKGSQAKSKEIQCLHPGDLYPFTRRPLFIIIDSDNSYVFQNVPRLFGQPLVILMSPIELPSSLYVSNSDCRQQGSLFTLFLHSPLTAFCHICDIHTIPLVHWDRGQLYIQTFLRETSHLISRSRIDVMFLNFMGDDFLRLLIIRFIFCEVVLRMHRAFRARTHLTRSSPPIPDDIIEHPALTHIVMDLASHLQVRGNFHDPSAAAGPPPTQE